MIIGLIKPMFLKGFLRTTETVAVDAVAAGIAVYAAGEELKSLLRTRK